MNLNITAEKAQNVKIQLFSLDGKLVQSKQLNLTEGINKETIHVSGFSNGEYVLFVSNQNGYLVEKVIVQN